MSEKKDITITEDLKDLVAERLDIIPPNLRISIGSKGTFSKDELIEHVKRGDGIGKTIIEAEINFLSAIKDGTLLKRFVEVENDNEDDKNDN